MKKGTQLSILLSLVAIVLLLVMTALSTNAAQISDPQATATQLARDFFATGTSETDLSAPPTIIASATVDVSVTRTQQAADNIATATQLATSSGSEPVLTLQGEAAITGTYWDTDWIIAWDEAGLIRLWNAASGEHLLTLEHGQPLMNVRLATDLPAVQMNRSGTRLLSWSNATNTCECPMQATVWDIDAASDTFGEALLTLEQPDDAQFLPGGGAQWNPDESLIVTWSRNRVAHVWDAETGQELALLQHNNIIWGVNWDAAGERLLTWSTDEQARMWDFATIIAEANTADELPLTVNRPLYQWVNRNVVWGAIWSPDETRVLTWSHDGRAVVRDAISGYPLAILQHQEFSWSAYWHGDDIVVSGLGGLVGIWDANAIGDDWIGRTLLPVQSLQPSTAGGFTRSHPQPEGTIIVSAGQQGIWGWDSRNSEVIFVKSLAGARVSWHPEGNYLLVTSERGAADVFGVPGGEPIATLVEEQRITGAQWHPDGNQILTWGTGGMLTIWDVDLAAPQAEAAFIPTSTPQPTDASTAVVSTQVATATPTFLPSPTLPILSRTRNDLGELQSFVAVEDSLQVVDVWLGAFQDNTQNGDILTLSLLDREFTSLGSVAQFIGSEVAGWVRFTFPEAMAMTPGETYTLRIVAEFGTSQRPLIGWGFSRDDPYPDGTSGIWWASSFDMPPTGVSFGIAGDNQYRLGDAAVATELPPVTVTPSPTATTIPPRETATAEAAWYISSIFSSLNPRSNYHREVALGDSLQLFIGYEECCYYIEQLDAEIDWSVRPDVDASIDANGLLTVAPDAELGELTVTARFAGQRLQTVITVYDPESQPYVGIWREDARIDCETDEFVEDGNLIGELAIQANGNFQVTWSPFEVYVDYTGTLFVMDTIMSFDGRSLNYFPPEFVGSGTYYMDDEGRLVMENIWFGVAPYGDDDFRGCGHRFVRVED